MAEHLPQIFLVNFLHKPLWMWLIFLCLVAFLLILDLGVFHKKDHEISIRESLCMSAFYISIGLLFGGFVWWHEGHISGANYITGFVIEKSLSMDNIFIMAMIFGYFSIPRIYQHQVLVWGIIGVIFLRGIMIGVGATLVEQFGWIMYIFAAFLVYTGIKMIASDDEDQADLSNNKILKFLKKYTRVTDKLYTNKFFIKLVAPNLKGKELIYLTPLMVTLIIIEISDIIFAVDSVPAIFAITTDPYVVYTSNVMAILGLRALYFALAAMIARFEYLKFALALILVFIGGKVFAVHLLGIEEFPPILSLAITIGILMSGVAYSLWKTKDVKE